MLITSVVVSATLRNGVMNAFMPSCTFVDLTECVVAVGDNVASDNFFEVLMSVRFVYLRWLMILRAMYSLVLVDDLVHVVIVAIRCHVRSGPFRLGPLPIVPRCKVLSMVTQYVL
jgi:hypothetical protein